MTASCYPILKQGLFHDVRCCPTTTISWNPCMTTTANSRFAAANGSNQPRSSKIIQDCEWHLPPALEDPRCGKLGTCIVQSTHMFPYNTKRPARGFAKGNTAASLRGRFMATDDWTAGMLLPLWGWNHTRGLGFTLESKRKQHQSTKRLRTWIIPQFQMLQLHESCSILCIFPAAYPLLVFGGGSSQETIVFKIQLCAWPMHTLKEQLHGCTAGHLLSKH